MQMKGLSQEQARGRISMFDVDGLLEPSRADLSDAQKAYAHKAPPSNDLVETIETLKPTILIGVSTKGGAFNQRVVEAMSRLNDAADHLRALQPDRQGGMHGRAGLRLVERQGALCGRRAVSRRDRRRQDLPPRTGEQLLHLPGDRACDLCGAAAADHRRLLHRRGRGERRPDRPRAARARACFSRARPTSWRPR